MNDQVKKDASQSNDRATVDMGDVEFKTDARFKARFEDHSNRPVGVAGDVRSGDMFLEQHFHYPPSSAVPPAAAPTSVMQSSGRDLTQKIYTGVKAAALLGVSSVFTVLGYMGVNDLANNGADGVVGKIAEKNANKIEMTSNPNIRVAAPKSVNLGEVRKMLEDQRNADNAARSPASATPDTGRAGPG